MLKKITLAAAAFAATSAVAQGTMAQNPDSSSTSTPPGASRTDPASVRTETPAGPEETRMRESLGTAGYSDIRDFKRDGTGWRGTAMYQGRRVPVQVGPDGQVMNRPK